MQVEVVTSSSTVVWWWSCRQYWWALLLLLLLAVVVKVDVVDTGLSWSSVLATGGGTAYLMSTTASLSPSWVVVKDSGKGELVRIF